MINFQLFFCSRFANLQKFSRISYIEPPYFYPYGIHLTFQFQFRGFGIVLYAGFSLIQLVILYHLDSCNIGHYDNASGKHRFRLAIHPMPLPPQY